MSVRVDSSSLISGAVVCGHRGLGVTGAVIRATTSTGAHGAGWLYDDWDNSGDDAKEFRLLIETPPSDGALFLYEDGSFSWVPVTDGTRNCVGRLYVDGADQGTEANYIVSGSGAATGQLAATEAADTAAITGDVIVTGAMAATEAADVAAIDGDTTPGDIEGALAATEAADVAAMSGGVRVSGSLAASESPDVAAFDGASALGTRAGSAIRKTQQLSGPSRPAQLGSVRRPRQLS